MDASSEPSSVVAAHLDVFSASSPSSAPTSKVITSLLAADVDGTDFAGATPAAKKLSTSQQEASIMSLKMAKMTGLLHLECPGSKKAKRL